MRNKSRNKIWEEERREEMAPALLLTANLSLEKQSSGRREGVTQKCHAAPSKEKKVRTKENQHDTDLKVLRHSLQLSAVTFSETGQRFTARK